VRWAAGGKGKSGGSRAIYYWLTAENQILFLTLYGKGEKENLTLPNSTGRGSCCFQCRPCRRGWPQTRTLGLHAKGRLLKIRSVVDIKPPTTNISPLLPGQGNTWGEAEGAGVREFCVNPFLKPQ
jgi:hypothetical protein